jgi:hypothetical protein
MPRRRARERELGRATLAVVAALLVSGPASPVQAGQPAEGLEASGEVSVVAERVASATVSVDATRDVGRVDPRLRGVHVPAWNETAFVNGSLDPRLLRAMKRFNVDFLVFPGGAFGLDWVWNKPSSPNEITTDQFLDLARELGATTKISVNPYQPPKLAADWIRYTNRVRHADVRYWEVVDEPYLHMSADEFIATMREFVPVMKRADPSIRIVTNITAENPEFSRKVIAEVGHLTDVWSIHFFPLPPSSTIDPSSPYSPDDKGAFYRDLLASPRTLAEQVERVRSWVREEHPDRSFEYHLGSWAPVWWGPEDWTVNALPDGLWAVDVLGTLATSRVDAAANWALMNPYPPGRGDFGLVDPEKRPYVIGDALDLWANHFGTRLVRATSNDPLLSAYASLSTDRRTLHVLLVNKRPDEDVEVSFDVAGVRPRGPAAAWILDGPTNPDHPGDYGLRRVAVPTVGERFSSTVPSYAAVALEIPLTPHATLAPPPNLARDKHAYASSEAFNTDGGGMWQTRDFIADRAVDGDPTTRWAAEFFVKEPQWFAVDLGQPQAFDRIDLDWEYWSTEYTVEVSDDGRSWRRVADSTDAVRIEPEPQPFERITLSEPVVARHVRVTMTGRPPTSGAKAGSSTWTPDAFSLWELGVYLTGR